ncbi:myelin protein zero-like protein 3 [Anguilla rostrata]|uniref:myelin protein zero-like protein 3 n=1 Tax=Anguilla rostrata TaxID=7938 RepID=UPI0030D3EE01
MGWRIPWRLCPNNAVFHCLIIGLAVCQVFPMEVRTSSEVEAVNGSSVTLTCTFKSSSQISSRVSVDWSYRPLSGGPTRSFLYFSSTPHLPLQGQFKGRVRWLGNPAGGDGSIQLLNASFTDNGTYTCDVKNPPDVHGTPSQIRLSVVPKQLAVRFTDVAVLMGLVLLPSAIIAPILLGRMWCCSKSCGVQRAKPVPSPIEVKEGEAAVYMDPTHKEKHITCCELYCRDFDDEYYIHDEMLQGGATDAETEC